MAIFRSKRTICSDFFCRGVCASCAQIQVNSQFIQNEKETEKYFDRTVYKSMQQYRLVHRSVFVFLSRIEGKETKRVSQCLVTLSNEKIYARPDNHESLRNISKKKKKTLNINTMDGAKPHRNSR